jgi:hypothetical protein
MISRIPFDTQDDRHELCSTWSQAACESSDRFRETSCLDEVFLGRHQLSSACLKEYTKNFIPFPDEGQTFHIFIRLYCR